MYTGGLLRLLFGAAHTNCLSLKHLLNMFVHIIVPSIVSLQCFKLSLDLMCGSLMGSYSRGDFNLS